jgi:hypothetical protein
VHSWTEKAKAAVDADFRKIMSAGAPVDKSPFEGLSSAPQIAVEPAFNHESCKADPDWANTWKRIF